MAKRLEGKVALITGGGSGIGRASALAFAREGAKVAIADISEKDGEETTEIIRQNQGEAIFIKTDVSSATQVKALIKKIVETFGCLNCALNNAGIEGNRTSTVACTEENWQRVIDINLKGIWLCMKYEIPYLRERGGGSIINMASVAGISAGLPRLSIYTTSKHGVVGLTKAAAVEYAKVGIRINAVCPGFIETSMLKRDIESATKLEEWLETIVPTGRLGTPEEVAEAVIWLASDASSFVTGHALVVDGGYSAI